MLAGLEMAAAQQAPAAAPDASPETIAQLLEQLKAQDARLKELEAQVEMLRGGSTATTTSLATAVARAHSRADVYCEICEIAGHDIMSCPAVMGGGPIAKSPAAVEGGDDDDDEV